MAQHVTTPHGPGVVVESDTVRGRTSYKVEGAFGSLWMDAAAIPEFGQVGWDEEEPVIQDNSTILPYDPTPQHYVDTGASTIQPNQTIDSDERLQSTDSVTGQPRNRPGPGPAPHLFAGRTASEDDERETYSDALRWAEDEYMPDPQGFATYVVNNGGRGRDYDIYQEMYDDFTNTLHHGRTADIDDPEIDRDEFPGGTNTPYGSETDDIQARLGDKFVSLPDLDYDRSTIQARLDEDPYRLISDLRIEQYEVRPPLDAKIGRMLDLEDSNANIRTAAWADVRAKASRIRRSGGVQLEAANPTAIVATVTGDHGIYTCAVLRGNALTGSSAVTEWSCSCPWGDWAFERQHTFVGRLCSHAYASLQELRSMNMRKEKPRNWSHSASVDAARGHSDDKWGDWLRSLDDDGTPPSNRWDVGDTPRTDDVGYYEDGVWHEHEGVESSRAAAIRSVPNFPSMTDDEVIDLHDSFPENVEDDDEAERFQEVEDEMVRRDLWGRGYEAARHERDDDELSLVPGTLTPDLNHIPQTHERRRVDLEAAREAEEREAFLSEPFEGSGADQKDSMGSSIDYLMEHETGEYVDIEEDTGNPVMPNGDEVMPGRTSSVEGGEDPLAYLLTGSTEGGGGHDDLSGAAEAFLRTAGRSFSMQEQQALIDEDAVGGTISTADLDLRGTHYLP